MWGWKAAGTPYMAVDVHALSQRAAKTNEQTNKYWSVFRTFFVYGTWKIMFELLYEFLIRCFQLNVLLLHFNCLERKMQNQFLHLILKNNDFQ